ncbi:hypothetical protein NXX53_18650 [Bacteroides salyersiae]|nr:hypothetical protein [Bacteroides salyersiae]
MKSHWGGGIGWTTKMPTLDYLFPDAYYKDIVQLGYYDVLNPEQNSRFNIRSYIEDRTNYELRPARNKKWELRADFTYGGESSVGKLFPRIHEYRFSICGQLYLLCL